MITVALVGCAHIHTPGFVKRLQARSDVAVKYVWDHDAERSRKQAEALSAQTVAAPEIVWADPEVKGVVICAETVRHEELVLGAAAGRKHLFVEKPLGMAAADAYRMARTVEFARVLFQTGYFQRGNPINLFLREQMLKGNFGQITRIRMSNCHAGSLKGWFDTEWRWMADLEQAGVGAFGDLGTHALDLMLWMMGDVTSVTASIGVAAGRYRDCDEYGEGLLQFEGGPVGTLAAGWVDVANPITTVVSGTEGHAYVCEGKLYFQSSRVPGADGKEPWTALPEAWPHAFELFLDALHGKNVPLVSVQEAAARSAVMEALYEGARRFCWVTPKSRSIIFADREDSA
jgi:predicted dehydrogenase